MAIILVPLLTVLIAIVVYILCRKYSKGNSQQKYEQAPNKV